MWCSQALLLLGSFFSLLNAQASIYQPISPKISWTNVGIEAPNIVIFFKTDFKTSATLTDFWIKLSVPFLANKLNANWSMIAPGQCSTSNLAFTPAYEERFEADDIWTTFYVQLKGATYTPEATYALKIQPDLYLDFTGFSDSIKIAFISQNVDGHIVYAYNNAFNCLYGTTQPATDIILNDATDDPNRMRLNQIINSYAIVQIKGGIAERLLFKTTGDYVFGDDAEIKCTTVADPKSNILEVPRTDYKCQFFQEIGGSNKNFLAFIWTNGTIAGGVYKFSFTLKTPIFGGSHSLSVFGMDRIGSRIHSMAMINNIFSTVPSPWAPGFPTLSYSFGISATDETMPQGLGIYSTTKGFNTVLNSFVFQLKAFDDVPSIPNGKAFSLVLQLGSTNAVCPLGSVYHDLSVADGFSQVDVTYASGIITFSNIYFFNGKIYTISLKAGYPDATTLSSDPATGFGFIGLIYNGQTIFKSQAVMRQGFTKVYDNKPLLTNRYLINIDSGIYNRRYRGLSAFRSTYSAAGGAIANLDVTHTQNGLKVGDGQTFVLQTSIGANQLFYSSTLDLEHDSTRTIFQLITHNSITSKTSSWEDSFSDSNCAMYYPRYSKWEGTLTTADMQPMAGARYTGITIDTPPAAYDFLGGCSYSQIQTKSLRYSRFRFRFNDVSFGCNTQPTTTFYLRGVYVAMYNGADITQAWAHKGTTYVWNNVDIQSYVSQINFGESDTVVLDMFFQVYFFVNDPITDVTLTSTPSISTMENLYVFGSTDTEFPVGSTFFAVHHTFSDYDAPTKHLTSNFGNLWPNIMHIHGTNGPMKNTVFAIKIYMDFIVPITMGVNSREVNCSFYGLAVTRCEIDPGMPDLLSNSYLDVDLATTLNAYAGNSRASNALIIYLNPSLTAGTYSITFPCRFMTTTNVDNIFDEYGKLAAAPSIMLLDNTYSPINYIDLSAGFDYLLEVYGPTATAGNYFDYTTRLLGGAATLDDATANNNPANAAWLGLLGTTRVGDTPAAGVVLKTNCQSCSTTAVSTLDFGAALLCAKWEFFWSSSWSANNLLVTNQFKCHRLKYYFDGPSYGMTASMVYCLYCPGADGVGATFANDAAALSFPIQGFTTPSSRGLEWPDETVGVIGGTRLINWLEMKTLTTLLSPNVITINTPTIAIKQSQLSIKLGFTFTVTNPLPKGSSAYLAISTGTNILSVLGKNQNPPCKIRINIVNLYNCQYTILAAGMLITTTQDVPAGTLGFELYGLSAGSTAAPQVQFTISTFLDAAMTPDKQLDASPGGSLLTFTWSPAATSGSIAVSGLTSNIWQSKASADITFTVTIKDRDVLVTDFISFNLGAAAIMDDTSLVLCYLTDFTNAVVLETVALCNVESLSNIIVSFKQDSTLKVFNVHLVGITIPEFSSPGLVATYKFNGDYIAFSSTPLLWTSIANFPKFTVPVSGYFELDGRGQRGDLLLTITPNSNIEVTRVMYIKFTTNFFPNISMYSYNVFQESDGMMLRSWIGGPSMLAVTGWLFSLEGGIPYTIRVVGIEVPSTLPSRQVQCLIADETGLNTIVQWGQTLISEAPSLLGSSLIFIDSINYDSQFIRVNTGLEADLIFQTTVPKFIYMRVFFDYLSNEIYKTFNPTCTMTLKGQGDNLITKCKSYGTKIEFFLGFDLVAGQTYRLTIKDILNPDYGYCEPIPPRFVVSNARKTRTVWISSNMVNNYERVPFVAQDGITMLNFVSIPDGYLPVWRGFYETVYVGPLSQELGARNYFKDKVTFTLSYDLDGLFASEPVYFMGVPSFMSQIGAARAPFIIGSNTNTVTTDYILFILRSETYSNQYTTLPLLKVRIVNQKAKLITPPTIKVFKGASSLPIYVYPEKIPTLPTTFKISFAETFTDGLEFKDDVTTITLGADNPLVFITIDAEITTTLSSVTLLIQKVDPNAPFIDVSLPVSIEPILSTGNPNFQVSTRSTTQFSTLIDFAADQVIYAVYYVVPTYEFKNLTKTTLEAWLSTGLTFIGDMKIGYVVINDPLTIFTVPYNDLLAETEYTIQVLYTTPLIKNFLETITVKFTTSPRGLVNGKLKLEFQEPLFSGRKMFLLCQTSILFAIPSEDLWTEDGLNCESSNIAPFVMNWHNVKEGILNNTIADSKDNVDPKILQPLKSMTMLIFSSRREFQPSDTYPVLFQATRKDDSMKTFQAQYGQAGTISYLGNLITLYVNDVPKIVGTPTYSINGTSVNIKGISLSQEGSLLLVYGRSELFSKSPSIADLKDVSGYSGYKYDFYEAETPIQILLNQSIDVKVNYTVYMVAFNNDPRKSAKYSSFVNLTFSIVQNTTSTFAALLRVGWAAFVLMLAVHLTH